MDMKLRRRNTFGIDVDVSGFGKITRGEMKEAIKAALQYVGQYWHDVLFPKRFAPEGNNTYHLQARSAKYIRTVRKRYSNWRPLNRTGNLMRHMMANYSIKPTVNNKVVSVQVKMRRPHATQAYVAGELVKVNKNEARQLRVIFKQQLMQRLAELQQKKREEKTNKVA